MFHQDALSLCGLTIRSVLPGSVRFTFWCSTSSTVKAADVPSSNGDEDENEAKSPAPLELSFNVGVQFGLTDAMSDTTLKFQGSLSF